MADEVQHSFNPVMGKTKLAEYLKEVGGRLKYVYDFVAMWNFKAELIEIQEKVNKKTKYPRTAVKNGDAPNQYEEHILPLDISDEDEKLLEQIRNKNHNEFVHSDDFDSEFKDEYDMDDEEEEDPFDAGFDEYESGGHGHGHDDY